jgi:HrpA-like RNA helicase
VLTRQYVRSSSFGLLLKIESISHTQFIFHNCYIFTYAQVMNYDIIEDVLTVLLQESSSPFTPPPAQGGNSCEEGPNVNISASGAVLIFMPGIGEIRTIMERLSGSRSFGNKQRFEIVPLHSTLSSEEQRRAFKPSPKGCRKIIISTNIAETRSVTFVPLIS